MIIPANIIDSGHLTFHLSLTPRGTERGLDSGTVTTEAVSDADELRKPTGEGGVQPGSQSSRITLADQRLEVLGQTADRVGLRAVLGEALQEGAFLSRERGCRTDEQASGLPGREQTQGPRRRVLLGPCPRAGGASTRRGTCAPVAHKAPQGAG